MTSKDLMQDSDCSSSQPDHSDNEKSSSHGSEAATKKVDWKVSSIFVMKKKNQLLF